MDQMLSNLFSLQFLIFCLGLAAVIFVVRKFVEFFVKTVKVLKLWHELILPVFPVVLGGLTGLFAQMYPYPEGIGSASGRVLFGLVAGLLSGLVYRVVKSLLKAKITFSESPDDDTLIESVSESINKNPAVTNTTDQTNSE
jgi:hypothetical protein